MKIILHWLILCAALWLTAYLLPHSIQFKPVYSVLVVGACLYFVNLTIRPLIGFATLAANILTLGLFSFVINGAILWSLAYVVSGFAVASFGAAMIAAVVVSVLHWVLEMLF